jgi:CheY-like chemotaxis protein
VQPRVINVSELVDDVVRMAGRLVPSSIELLYQPPSTAPAVLIDPTQLEQVVMNLIVNARDAIQDGGRITVEIGECAADDATASDAPDHGYVTITVRDTGTGIPDDVRPYVFEPFYTTKMQGEGTGLGLSTSYGIVRQAGGSIRFESAPSGGTSFEVRLPMTTQAPAPAIEAPAAPRRVTGARVLLVEDDDSVRTTATRVLQGAGFDVRAAANGADALEIFARDGGVRVLVTDVIMPRVSGRALAVQLRERAPELAVLFLSGYLEDPEFERSMPEGARFLQKPVSPKELARVVQELADRTER